MGRRTYHAGLLFLVLFAGFVALVAAGHDRGLVFGFLTVGIRLGWLRVVLGCRDGRLLYVSSKERKVFQVESGGMGDFP